MKVLIPIQSREWRRDLMFLAASFFPVLTALLLSGFVPTQHAVPFASGVVPLVPVETLSANELESLFEDIGYKWPPQGRVPPLEVSQLPPDITHLSVKRKKSLFFRVLLPLIVAENERLRQARHWLEGVMEHGYIDDMVQRSRLQRLLEEFGLETNDEIDSGQLEQLYQRVDVIPPGLALAQAANESGWGTSRFSLQVNNLFGEWTYRADEGIVPLRRREGAEHYVRRFGSLRDSVRSYINNLNRHRAYSSFRRLRADQRRKGVEPDAMTLAGGLLRYSGKGKAYVASIRALINNNGLNDLDPQRLARSATVD